MIDYSQYSIKFPSWKEKLNKHYKYLGDDEFYADIKERPYHVFCDVLDMSFATADKIIMEHRLIAPNSHHRCQYAVYAALKANESNGNTRMTDSAIAQFVHNVAPESMGHIVDVVKTDEHIYYEEPRHLVSRVGTWKAEVNIASNIKKRLKKPEVLNIDVNKYRKIDENELTDEQITALQMTANNAVCMVNGSAGTGKSFTSKAIVDMLEDNGLQVALLAPTGIAAKVLRTYTKHSASTVHMFLLNKWEPDIVLIDEMSMVSVHLLSMLFNAIDAKTRFIFVADNAQLASISCGNIVQDMISSSIVPRVELTKIFRYNTSGIVTMATDMRHGSVEHLTEQYPDYQFIETGDESIEQVISVYDSLLKNGYTQDDIAILCPFKKRNGTNEINQLISERYNKNRTITAKSVLKVGDKVINIKNDYSEGVDNFIANGDIGYLVSYSRGNVKVEFDFGVRQIKSLQRIEQATALTIHKVQGSSFKVAIVYIDKPHEFFLTKNLLYTAVTRAREKLIIIGNANAVEVGASVSANESRNTWLKEMLLENE